RVVYWTAKGIFWTRADGSGAAVRLVEGSRRPLWFTPDGLKLAHQSVSQASRGCVLVSISGDPDRPTAGAPEPCFRPHTLPESSLNVTTQISPDGRWLAAGVPGSQGAELFVISFPDRGGRWQISKVGGAMPRWSLDGKRLYFMNPEGRVMFSDVDTRGGAISATPPRNWSENLVLDSMSRRIQSYTPSPDGKQIFMAFDPKPAQHVGAQLQLVQNFDTELRKRLAR
ncbi:MAG: hypothetical protein FJW32_18185, partial [Acidobacteria bacterium]|nr:hypothetical protein [Acidobacteriota bacterium]